MATPAEKNGGRPFVLVSAGVLGVFALAKLISLAAVLSGLLDSQVVLRSTPPLLLAVLAMAELLAAGLMLWCLSEKAASLLTCVIGTTFLANRFWGGGAECPCTGGLTSLSPWLHDKEENLLLSTALGLVFLGVLGWVRASRRQLRIETLPVRPFYCKPLPVVLSVVLLSALAIYVPLSGAPVIGGDDPFELSKAQLLHRRPDLAARLSNDQPWLHTLLIARLFGIFGENAAIPRLFTLACTLALGLACFRILGKDAGTLEKILFLAFFFTSTYVLKLAASAMLELPAFALAVCAVSLTLTPHHKDRPWHDFLAGLLLAAAAFVKLTALIVVPAWALTLGIGRREEISRRGLLLLWLGILSGGLLYLWIAPTFSIEDLWLRHWRARAIAWSRGDASTPTWGDVVNDVTIFLAIIAGLKYLVRHGVRHSPGLFFAAVWLLTCLLVLAFHRPWWSFYALHFHVPMAILAAQGAGGLIRRVWSGMLDRYDAPDPRQVIPAATNPGRDAPSGFVPAAIAVTLLVSSGFGFRFPATLEQVWQIGHARTAENDYFLPTIRQYAPRASWLYTHDWTRAFHSGILQPPELVLWTYKRFALGEISDAAIFEICQRYRPEILLLSDAGELLQQQLKDWAAKSRYVRILRVGSDELWVAETLAPDKVRARDPEELIRDLRL